MQVKLTRQGIILHSAVHPGGGGLPTVGHPIKYSVSLGAEPPALYFIGFPPPPPT